MNAAEVVNENVKLEPNVHVDILCSVFKRMFKDVHIISCAD